MDVVLVFIGLLIVGGIGFLILRTNNAPSEESLKLKADLQSLQKEHAGLLKELDIEKKEKNELSGKGKESYDHYKSLESEYKATLKERDLLKATIAKFESNREQQSKDQEDHIAKLENAQKALEEERERVKEEETERRKHADEERDRIWAEHEMNVISELIDLSKQPYFQFTSYTNTNLPEDFDGRLKPDFLIEFLDQYVIFDAKVSKAQSLQTYINEAVKGTADKVKKNDKIYPHVFLVVPTEAIGELKKLIYMKENYYFYIISREALAPILAFLKRISTYELAESLDPQKRENIINMLSELTTHISTRNAYELLLTKHGADTLDRVAKIDPEVAEEVQQKNIGRKPHQFSPTEIKRLTMSLTEQNISSQELVSPKAAVKKKDLERAASSMAQELI